MAKEKNSSFNDLLRDVRACTICEASLVDGVRPVLQVHPAARVLIVGQAPGRRVHESGVPFDDPSGDRLREWMGVERETFYDPEQVAILPMGFCFPGSGSSGDLPPRSECAQAWREELLAQLNEVRLTLVIGKYAIDWHLKPEGQNLTETVQDWKRYRPKFLPLPHPSPRNNLWLKKNPSFGVEVLPYLKRRVRNVLQ